MASPGTVPGDKAVDLAAPLRSAATLAAAVVAAVSLWALERRVLWTMAAVVLGGVGGFRPGAALGRVFFPGPGGGVVVVKLGPGALSPAFKAGVFGGVCSGIVAGLEPPRILSQPSKLAGLVGTGVVVGIVIGAARAYIATRA